MIYGDMRVMLVDWLRCVRRMLTTGQNCGRSAGKRTLGSLATGVTALGVTMDMIMSKKKMARDTLCSAVSFIDNHGNCQLQ